MRIGAPAARRIALAAQGFGRPRPGTSPPGPAQLTRTIRQLGVLQLDSVNVFSRAHYMPLFSRLGPYDRSILDRLTAHTEGRLNRRFIEYWAHEAALIPVENQPLFRWRMADVEQAWGGIQRIAREEPALVAETLELVRAEGPLRARDTGFARPALQEGAMWNWHEGKRALEYLFFTGQITAARRVNFERRYDLPERILPPEVHGAPTPSRAEALTELTRIAARALGVATAADLADYWRVTQTELGPLIAGLTEAGELLKVEVAGWKDPAYLWHEARRPRALHARALLSPFDSLIFFRPRTERLFGFHYRIEIYVPEPKRTYGYYVLPFLLGDALVARVDLKSDRAAGVLRVNGAFGEAGVDPAAVVGELAAELALVAGWQGLTNGVAVGTRGDLAGPLARAL